MRFVFCRIKLFGKSCGLYGYPAALSWLNVKLKRPTTSNHHLFALPGPPSWLKDSAQIPPARPHRHPGQYSPVQLIRETRLAKTCPLNLATPSMSVSIRLVMSKRLQSAVFFHQIAQGNPLLLMNSLKPIISKPTQTGVMNAVGIFRL